MFDFITGLLAIDTVWKLNGPPVSDRAGVKYAVDAVFGGSSPSAIAISGDSILTGGSELRL